MVSRRDNVKSHIENVHGSEKTVFPKTSPLISPEISPKVDVIQKNEEYFDEILVQLPTQRKPLMCFFHKNEAEVGKVTHKTPEMLQILSLQREI